MERREPARLALRKGEFVLPMRAARDAARSLNHRLALLDATWEPHDWADFD